METIIRKFNHADESSCMDAFKSNVPTFFTEEEVKDFETFFRRMESGHDKAHYYVVVFDQKVIGCGGFGDKENNGIFSLAWGFIHKDFHKKGLGKKLLVHRLALIKQLNPEAVIVIDTTQHSFGFFEKQGFRITKITEDFYTKGMHRYDMTLKV